MKFLIDMPLSPELADWLASRGHDAIHAGKVGLARAADRVIFQQARSEQRVIITADLDFPRLLAISRSDGPGLILFRGGNYSGKKAIERLIRVFEKIAEEELPHSIIVIEQKRIRRRRLPLG